MDAFFTALINHGSWVLGGVLFLAALGVPLPATLLLLAAGAFAQQGLLDALEVGLVATSAAVAGDHGSYLVGRWAGAWLPARWVGGPPWQRAAAGFERWGMASVFLTRFLLTPLALPVNLLAGSTRYPWPKFSLAVVTGEATWVLLFAGAGYLFADRWEALGGLAGDVAWLAVGLVLLALGVRGLLQRGRSSRAPPLAGPPGTPP